MPNVTMMQVLVLRAIHGMPAGASAAAIHEAVRADTGLIVKHGFNTLYTLLSKGYITERRMTQRRFRHEAVAFYSLTPSGRALLKERTVVRMQVSRPVAAARTQEQVAAQRLAEVFEPLPAYRYASRRECKAAGVPLWKMSRAARERREERRG